MFIAFLYFMAGVITLKILQFFLSITPNYNIFKETEMTCLKILGEMYLNQQICLRLLKTVYDESDSNEEYKLAEKTIKLHYDTLINNSLVVMKKSLPYKVPYTTLNEAFSYYTQKQKTGE